MKLYQTKQKFVTATKCPCTQEELDDILTFAKGLGVTASGRIIHTVPGHTVDLTFEPKGNRPACRTVADEDDMLWWDAEELRWQSTPAKTFLARWSVIADN